MIPVVWVAQVYPRFEGDLFGGFLHRLAREMPDRGYRPIVVAPAAAGTPDRATVDGVEVVRFNSAGAERAGLVYSGEMHRAALRAPVAFVRFLKEFRVAAAEVVRREEPALVHAHWWFPGGWVAAPLARPERPLVVSLHGTDVRLLGKMPPARGIARRVLSKASRVLPVSEALRSDVEACLGRDYPGSVLPMPADADVFCRSPVAMSSGGVRFVVAARLTRQKRVADAIRALGRVVVSHPDVKLDVVGDGPERSALEQLAAGLGLGSQVTFFGTLEGPELADRFRGARAAILCSEREGYGLTLVEAALCGTAGIGVRSGALPELIEPGVTGLLVPPNDLGGLAEAIRALAEAPADASRMGTAAAAAAAPRTAPPLADRLQEIYRGLTELPSRP